MGQLIEELARTRGHEVVARLSEGDPLALPPDTEVAIDFSIPSAAERLCRYALERGIAVVSGTTGWDTTALRRLADGNVPKIGGFLHATNMSVGVNVVFAVNRVLAKALAPHGYRASIEETHHVHKLDAPSGTAVTLAGAIVAATPAVTDFTLVDQSTTLPDDVLPITSRREGEVVGEHRVDYESAVDRITLQHAAKSRAGFALGAVLAAEYMVGRRGVHTMEEVLGLNDLRS